MNQTFYTTGYTGKNVEELKDLLTSLDAVLVDIRFSAQSRHLKWTQDYLKILLKNRYRYVPALGNRTYKENRITIQNLDLGMRTIISYQTNVVLMCGCKELRACHRYVIMKELLDRGYNCEEIHAWSVVQAELF